MFLEYAKENAFGWAKKISICDPFAQKQANEVDHRIGGTHEFRRQVDGILTYLPTSRSSSNLKSARGCNADYVNARHSFDVRILQISKLPYL